MPTADLPESERRKRAGRVPTARAFLVLLPFLGLSTALAAQTLQDAIALHLSGRFDEALDAYRAVAAANEASEPAVAASAFTNSCLIHMNRSEYERALGACERALQLRRLADDPPRTARTLNNLGLSLQNLGRYQESRERFLEALRINSASGDPLAVAQNLGNLAGLAIQAGDYAEALGRIAEVLEVASSHPEADWHHEQRRLAFLNEGVVLEKLGAFRDALASYRRALDEAGSLDDGLEASLTVNMGVVYRNLGDPVRALDMFRQAAETFRRLGNPSGLSNALLNTALALHLNLDRSDEAERAYREALALAIEIGDRPEQIQDLFYLGTLLLEQQRLGEAGELFERALALSEESGSAEGRWSALAGLGRIAAALGRPAEASARFERALETIEGVRTGLTPESHRADFFGDKRSVYASAVQAAVNLHAGEPHARHDEAAFRLVQRAKVRELLDALGNAGAGGPLDWREVAGELPSRGTVVEYFFAERDLLRFALDRHGLQMRSLGPVASLTAASANVYRALSNGRSPERADLDLLAERLTGDLELAGPLFIAADGPLRYLPFELLPLAGGDGVTLLEAAPISYLPSASALPSLARRRDLPVLRAIGVANPVIDGGTVSRPATLIAERFGLGALPAAERELATLERRLGGPTQLLTGADATERAVADALRGGARVIHLATHAVIDERPGRGAAVLLAAGGSDDGLLYPEEIARLELRAELAVLAACRTALGAEGDSSSLATLTGAFLAAGAGAVVATLWDVDDEVTAVFMDQFYWQLGRGLEPGEALRRAKLAFRRQSAWSAPHLWAGYVLIGSARPVAAEGRSPTGWILAVLFVVAAGLWLRYRRP